MPRLSWRRQNVKLKGKLKTKQPISSMTHMTRMFFSEKERRQRKIIIRRDIIRYLCRIVFDVQVYYCDCYCFVHSLPYIGVVGVATEKDN